MHTSITDAQTGIVYDRSDVARADRYAEKFIEFTSLINDWVFPSDDTLAGLYVPHDLYDLTRFVIHRDWT